MKDLRNTVGNRYNAFASSFTGKTMLMSSLVRVSITTIPGLCTLSAARVKRVKFS